MVELSKPWLLIPTAWAHSYAPFGTRMAARLLGQEKTPQWKSLNWNQLNFPNPLGIAGGVDKNADNLRDWQRLGCGFIEVGTITPRPQDSNPSPIVDRNKQKQWLWNRLGFPNEGLEAIKKKIESFREHKKVPLFANIGKNRDTPNNEAHKDYLKLIESLSGCCDAFVVNISSPNTKGLRELLEPAALGPFLNSLQNKNTSQRPLLLKLSPDLDNKLLTQVVDTSLESGFKGFVLTNTLANQTEYFPRNHGGGVSGQALKKRSEEVLQLVTKHLEKLQKKDVLVVSVGGVLGPEDVFKRLRMGAHLVQSYSALIFDGPGFFLRTAKVATCH